MRRSLLVRMTIDLVGPRIGLHVLRPVHFGGAQQVAGPTRLDQHIGLAVEAVGRRQRAVAVNERQPFPAAVGVVSGDVERARRRAGRGWRHGLFAVHGARVTNL